MTISHEKKESLIPSVEILEKYEKISKGLSKELVSLLKKEQEHRHKMQKMYLRHFKLGQLFGALFLVFIISMIFELAKNGNLEISCLMSIIFGILIVLILYQCRKDKLSIIMKNTGRNNFFKKNKNYNRNSKGKTDKQINKNEVK